MRFSEIFDRLAKEYYKLTGKYPISGEVGFERNIVKIPKLLSMDRYIDVYSFIEDGLLIICLPIFDKLVSYRLNDELIKSTFSMFVANLICRAIENEILDWGNIKRVSLDYIGWEIEE